jgi:hypothetical protein
MMLFYQVATRLSLTTCWQIVNLKDDNKLLEQLVTRLLSSTSQQPYLLKKNLLKNVFNHAGHTQHICKIQWVDFQMERVLLSK